MARHAERAPYVTMSLVVILLQLVGWPARAQDVPDDPGEVLAVEISLRAYAIYPKFRFRDGHVGGPGSNFRTQRIGLDDWAFGPGVSAGARIMDSAWVGFHFWGYGAEGVGTLTSDMVLGSTSLPAGRRAQTDCALWYGAVEYLHRLELLDGVIRADVGLRGEYLELRANVVQAGRVKIEALWPSPRLEVGLRPLTWLELRGWVGGFHLDFPVANTEVTQVYDVGGSVRLDLPRGAYLEAGGFMLHVHLEEHVGEPREDVLHLRHRTFFFTLGWAF